MAVWKTTFPSTQEVVDGAKILAGPVVPRRTLGVQGHFLPPGFVRMSRAESFSKRIVRSQFSPLCVCVFVYDRKNQMPRNTENPGRHIKDWETCNVCVQVNIGHLEDGQNGWAKWGPSGVQV